MEHREEYNSKIGLLFALTLIEKELNVKFSIKNSYFYTFCHTLDYKTVSKAMIIQALEGLVLHATTSISVESKKENQPNITKTTKKVPYHS